MSITNFKEITTAVKNLLEADSGLSTAFPNRIIERNTMSNRDPERAVNGWIGIYKAGISLENWAIGNNRWRTTPDVIIEAQYCNFESGEKAEDGLHDLEDAILEVLGTSDNSDLNDTVKLITGIDIDYEILSDSRDIGQVPYWHVSIITLKTEGRT